MKIKVFSIVICIILLASCSNAVYAENNIIKQNSIENDDMINERKDIMLKIDEIEVEVDWENNESVEELKKLAKNGIIIQTHRYGGFEQVGEIGQSIVSNNIQMITEPGDIVLYAGSNIVVFYGSNSWSYTKLGKIKNKTNEELKNMLSKNNVILKFIY